MTASPVTSRLRGALAGVWLKSRDRIFERVARLDATAVQLLEGALPEDARREAERAAHQLAGSCGTFGFAGATELAREAERTLAGAAPIPPAAVLRLAEIAVALREQLEAGVPGVTDVGQDDAGESSPASMESPVSPAAGAELILALDDDSHALDIIAALVQPAGYQLVGATDPHLFMELLGTLAPSLVILDVDMPVLDGLELCRRLRADRRWVALPVLFLTARTDTETVAGLFSAGADDYAAKPVVGPELVARIRNRLERSRLPRHAPSRPAADTDIVIVDDDEVLVGLLTQALTTGGYSVTSFGAGPAALGALTSAPGGEPMVRGRVVVLDVGLPGMDGLTVLRALARQGVTKHSRVVMLTARTSEAEVVQALELGAFDHVAKPFSVPVLLQRIRRAFDAVATP